jgi:predicted ATP-dependent protease
MSVKPLSSDEIYKKCDVTKFDFKTTAELDEMLSPLGQDRAISAVKFCINVDAKGYNMFCLGPEGTGKTSLVKHILKKAAVDRPAPDDWCYVNNFAEPHKPHAIRFPAGMAVDFSKDMEKLIEELQVAIPAAFEGEEYQNRLAVIEERYKDKKNEYFDELQKKATGKNVSLLRMPVGLVVAPTRDGEVLSPEAFDKLPEAEQKELLAELNEMQEELEMAVKDVPKWEKDQREELKELNKQVTDFAVVHLIDELKKKYKSIKDAVSYLKEVHEDIIENVDDFLEEEEEDAQVSNAIKRAVGGGSSSMFRHYMANPVVKNDPEKGAPIVFLDHPTLTNLVGRVEKLQQFGALISDFNLIKAGALHEANGGFLLIDAKKLLTQPHAWESLKRTIRSKQIKIESAEESLGFSTISLTPEPIPLAVKVILIGDADLYYTLSSYDSDFGDLFKVEADFCKKIFYYAIIYVFFHKTNHNIRYRF